VSAHFSFLYLTQGSQMKVMLSGVRLLAASRRLIVRP